MRFAQSSKLAKHRSQSQTHMSGLAKWLKPNSSRKETPEWLNGPAQLQSIHGSACSDQTQGLQTYLTPFIVVIDRNEEQNQHCQNVKVIRNPGCGCWDARPYLASICKPTKPCSPQPPWISKLHLDAKRSMLGPWSTLNSPTSSHGVSIIVLCDRFALRQWRMGRAITFRSSVRYDKLKIISFLWESKLN